MRCPSLFGAFCTLTRVSVLPQLYTGVKDQSFEKTFYEQQLATWAWSAGGMYWSWRLDTSQQDLANGLDYSQYSFSASPLPSSALRIPTLAASLSLSRLTVVITLCLRHRPAQQQRNDPQARGLQPGRHHDRRVGAGLPRGGRGRPLLLVRRRAGQRRALRDWLGPDLDCRGLGALVGAGPDAHGDVDDRQHDGDGAPAQAGCAHRVLRAHSIVFSPPDCLLICCPPLFARLVRHGPSLQPTHFRFRPPVSVLCKRNLPLKRVGEQFRGPARRSRPEKSGPLRVGKRVLCPGFPTSLAWSTQVLCGQLRSPVQELHELITRARQARCCRQAVADQRALLERFNVDLSSSASPRPPPVHHALLHPRGHLGSRAQLPGTRRARHYQVAVDRLLPLRCSRKTTRPPPALPARDYMDSSAPASTPTATAVEAHVEEAGSTADVPLPPPPRPKVARSVTVFRELLDDLSEPIPTYEELEVRSQSLLARRTGS